MDFAKAVEGPVGIVELAGQGFAGVVRENCDGCAFAEGSDCVNGD